MSSENEHARLDRAESAQAMIEALAGLFPATFVADENALHRPLAIGTDKALRERCPSLSTHARKRALSAYAARPNYLKALVEGAARLDLSGNVNGVVTAKDAAYAVRRLAALPAQPAPVMVPPSPPLSPSPSPPISAVKLRTAASHDEDDLRRESEAIKNSRKSLDTAKKRPVVVVVKSKRKGT